MKNTRSKIFKSYRLLLRAMHLCKTQDIEGSAMYDELLGSLDDALYYSERLQEELSEY